MSFFNEYTWFIISFFSDEDSLSSPRHGDSTNSGAFLCLSMSLSLSIAVRLY